MTLPRPSRLHSNGSRGPRPGGVLDDFTTDETTSTTTRRRVLRTGAVAAGSALGTGVGTGTVAGGRSFGRVYASGDRYRTNVVRVLDEEPAPKDLLYFLHDGSGPVSDGVQLSPFVSESAPGDQDWNGDKWVSMGALVTDMTAFETDPNRPLDSADKLLSAPYVTVSATVPSFGPPTYFLCSLNGPAGPDRNPNRK